MNVATPHHTPLESRILLTSHGELKLDKKVQVTVDSEVGSECRIHTYRSSITFDCIDTHQHTVVPGIQRWLADRSGATRTSPRLR